MPISIVNGWSEEAHFFKKSDAEKEATRYKAKGYKTRVTYTKPQWSIALGKKVPFGYALWIKRR
jgi:hypothetical protein